ncbi:hypothetical protein APSETT445_006530 [Aspergillus pseudonomiae]
MVRHGIPAIPHRDGHLDSPSSVAKMGILDSIRSVIAFPGPELILHKRHAPNPVPRHRIRHRRLLCLRAIDPLHARLSGSGLTGIIFPLILQSLLDAYGWQTTLRICSVAIFLLAAPFMLFHRPRLPRTTTNLHQLDLSFHRNRTYLIYQACNVVQSLGFFVPQLFLPSYAGLLGAKGLAASSTITVFNISAIFGCILIGWLADRYHVTKCILISTVGGVCSTFLLWGLSVHLAPLYLFTIVYACTGASFSSSWAATSAEVRKSHPSADVSMVFAFLETGRGIGNVISGPLSEALLKTRLWEGQAWGAYGTEYGILVVLTGVTGLLGGVSVVARALRWI